MLETKTIEVNQLHYHIQHYQFDANRPTILFLHDSLGSVKLWRDFPQKLAELTQCNFLVYDREGHGESSPFSIEKRATNYLELGADTLHLILSKLQLKDIILFGHSDGATISLLYAAKYPQNVIATIVEGVHVFVEEETLQGIREAKKALETTNLAERVAKYHGDKTHKLFQMWMETWLDPSYRDWNIEKNIQSIQSPILVFQGENDEFGTMEQVNKIKANVKSLVIDHYVNDCGHNPHKEQTEFTLNQSKEFLNHILNRHDAHVQ